MNARPITLGRPLKTLQAGEFLVVGSSYAPSLALLRHGHDEAALCFAVRGSFDESVDGRTFDCAPYDTSWCGCSECCIRTDMGREERVACWWE